MLNPVVRNVLEAVSSSSSNIGHGSSRAAVAFDLVYIIVPILHMLQGWVVSSCIPIPHLPLCSLNQTLPNTPSAELGKWGSGSSGSLYN